MNEKGSPIAGQQIIQLDAPKTIRQKRPSRRPSWRMTAAAQDRTVDRMPYQGPQGPGKVAEPALMSDSMSRQEQGSSLVKSRRGMSPDWTIGTFVDFAGALQGPGKVVHAV